jgi:prepilin-type N-terminal cleavage/methylation domain-containing protein
MRKTAEQGFTLIEMMVTVAIIAVMVGIAIPSVLAWMPAANLRDAAFDLRTAMIRARSLAVNEGIEYRVAFDVDNHSYTVDRGNLSSGSTAWTSVVGPFDLPTGIEFQSTSPEMEATGSVHYIRFETDGGVQTNVDALNVVVVNSNTDTYEVSVQRRTGHADMTKGA